MKWINLFLLAMAAWMLLIDPTKWSFLAAGILIGLVVADLNDWHINRSMLRKYGVVQKWRKP